MLPASGVTIAVEPFSSVIAVAVAGIAVVPTVAAGAAVETTVTG